MQTVFTGEPSPQGIGFAPHPVGLESDVRAIVEIPPGKRWSIPFRDEAGEIWQTIEVAAMSRREAAISREIRGPRWVRLYFGLIVVAIRVDRHDGR